MESISKNKFDNANLRLLKHHTFASNFEHWNLASNETYSQFYFFNPVIVLFLWFFKDKRHKFFNPIPMFSIIDSHQGSVYVVDLHHKFENNIIE